MSPPGFLVKIQGLEWGDEVARNIGTILDESDTLRSITNTGVISGILISDGREDDETGSQIAIDLSSQNGGATIRQYQETPGLPPEKWSVI